MAEHVMDCITAYIVHGSGLTPSRFSHRLCLVPATVSGNIMRFKNSAQGPTAWIKANGPDALLELKNLREMVWTHSEPPTLVMIPIINHSQVHSYLWFGEVQTWDDAGLHNLELHLLDSLSRPSRKEIESRLAICSSIIRFVLPQVTGRINGSYMEMPEYRQAPGSTDCGWFVCQAVSALSHRQKDMLHRPLPRKLLKSGARQILEACKSGALEMLACGVPPAHLLILHQEPHAAPPPWRPQSPHSSGAPAPHKREPWVTPVLERTLSEPLGDTPGYNLGHGSWEDILGPRADLAFGEASREAFQGYLSAIEKGEFTSPPGLLANVGAQLPDSLMGALLLEGDMDHMEWAPDAELSGNSDEEGLEDPDGGVGLRRFQRGLSTIPRGLDRSKAILTGVHHDLPLSLNWAKESVDLEEDWLKPGLDVDSLSLTAREPQFTDHIVIYPYPPRGSTLTTDNGLSVRLGKKKIKKMSHSESLLFLDHATPGSTYHGSSELYIRPHRIQ
jgi:hypothetical protein